MYTIINDKHVIFDLAKDVREICQPLFQRYGLNFFNYTRVFPDGSFATLTTTPEWRAYFINNSFTEQSYYKQHPTLYGNDTYMIWDAVVSSRTEKSGSIINQVAKDRFQLNHGLTISTGNKHLIERFSFAAPEDNLRLNDYYETDQDIFKRFTFYFKDKGSRLIQQVDQNKIVYPKHIKLPKEAFQKQDTFKDLDFKIDRLHIETPMGSCYLTKRELDCSVWAYQGKTNEEIGLILGLSKTTVKSHLNAVKDKLGVNKIVDVIRVLQQQEIFSLFGTV